MKGLPDAWGARAFFNGFCHPRLPRHLLPTETQRLAFSEIDLPMPRWPRTLCVPRPPPPLFAEPTDRSSLDVTGHSTPYTAELSEPSETPADAKVAQRAEKAGQMVFGISYLTSHQPMEL